MKVRAMILVGTILGLAGLFFLPHCTAVAEDAEVSQAATAEALQRAFVWLPSAPFGKQAYVVFRKEFDLSQTPKSAVLNLFADSRYILWINGKYVGRGPCRFDPIGPEYDVLDVASYLQPGKNLVAVLVHHYHDGKPMENGDSFAGRIMRHVPGLTASLVMTAANGEKQEIQTDGTWRAGAENRFGPSPVSWSSVPDNIDVRRDSGDWTAVAFDDSSWEKAVAIDGKQWGALHVRRIPLLRESEVQPLSVVLRKTGAREPQIFGQSSVADKPELATLLPLELGPGDQLVVDANRFVQAYSEMDFEAENGSQLEIRYAQTFLSSNRQPEGWQGVGVCRYLAKQGRQTIMSSDTFGCKYMSIQCTTGKVRILGVKLVNRVYPFDVVGKFNSNDPLLNEIWQLGVRTILICSEDAYVDCAERERVEWLGDAVMVSYPISRLTMAGPGPDGKPYWSDPRLFGNALRHMGQSVQADGRVKAHHPSNRWDIHGYIEDYSCVWIQGIHTWQQHTGDLGLVRELWPAVKAQLRWFLDHRTERGLVRAREFVFPGNPTVYKVCEGTTLNAFVAQALLDAAELAKLLGETKEQQEYAEAGKAIQEALNAHLWNDAERVYFAGLDDKGSPIAPTAHAAAIPLFCSIVPPARRQGVESFLLKNLGSNEFAPFQYVYCLEDLARMHSEQADLAALQVIRQRWEPMTKFETQTTWEAFSPGEDCHDMGSAPTIYLSRYVLGVGLDGPASNHRLLIEPHLGDLTKVEGVVVTELGPVSVNWTRPAVNGKWSFDLEIPAGVTAQVLLPEPKDGSRLIVDGAEMDRLCDSASRKVLIDLRPGKHHGEF